MAERPWQCLQTGAGRETFERDGRTEEQNREVREGDMRADCLTEACAAGNASNLAVLEAGKATALKYDVMRVCMGPEVLELLLPGAFGDNERIWCRCRPNGLGFPANMRTRSSTVR